MTTPTVDQLLEELTVEIDVESFIEEITQTELPPAVGTFAQRYEETIGMRDAFLWQWLYAILDHFMLEVVPTEKAEEVRTVKTLFSMYMTILDDLADAAGDRVTFEQARMLPTPITVSEPSADVNEPVFSLVEDLWAVVTNRLHALPRYAEFNTLFTFDTRQAITAMDYSLLVNETPAIATRAGVHHYDQHNMCVFPYIDIDLMATPDVVEADLAPLRELHWIAQRMARIGNWVTTWEREVHEGDVSSGIVVKALRDGIVTPEQLRTDPEAAVKAIGASEIEATLIERWHTLHSELRNVEETAISVDLDQIADRMATVMAFHLASEGYK